MNKSKKIGDKRKARAKKAAGKNRNRGQKLGPTHRAADWLTNLERELGRS